MPCRWSALLATTLAASAAAQGPDTLIFGTTHESEAVVFVYATDYLQRLCAEIHQRCALQSLPGRRSEAMLGDGSLAGEMGRVKEYGYKHPQYLRIEEPFVQTHTYVFTPRGQPAINSWEELAATARSVSYKRGIYTYQTKLEALQPRLRPHDVQNVPACLEMVIKGRDQACVYDDGSLSAASRAMLSQGRIGRPLEQLDLYIYVGADQRALVAGINAAARRLQAQGIKEELRRKYFVR
ncbi:transporter substrate-binding domain-containing protein [Duganella sp. FT109W]|uniref:Transporter substrate-binding domain-containing protein n=1 Tax=Duganella margarita TaxID=2692170 RepID=A0ABW9WBW5_9BURK|nr:transporter substrate-binding domain-containing protein [Duganella margarita]MYN38503.1 transporter substrate-binding domain-containing protein [Duganella margarita]